MFASTAKVVMRIILPPNVDYRRGILDQGAANYRYRRTLGFGKVSKLPGLRAPERPLFTPSPLVDPAVALRTQGIGVCSAEVC